MTMYISTISDYRMAEAVETIFGKNGPDQQDYKNILDLINTLDASEIPDFREVMQPILNPNTIIGFSYSKPFGYNGDFFIIEKIYQKYVNPDPKYKKWDEFFHTFPAAIAVINRKALAVETLKKLNARRDKRQKSVLILGSGPVTEVYEYFRQIEDNTLTFDLLDLDNRSIAYAKNKHRANLHLMNFMNENVIRFNPDKKYDLIWSAGLFDYFKDKHFVYLIKKYFDYVDEGGEMIIGNFNISNPSRKIMEVLGDWFLYHRNESELRQFAMRAGVHYSKIEIIKEPLGINLFLKIKN
jgi:extracellular factor (EF) 3-hydroxypalmitic acid methyl ester biosynthesis protein